MKIFIDTNVLLDVLEQRAPHYEFSSQVWALAESGRADGYISAISFNNIHYLLQKHSGRAAAQRAVEIMNAVFTMVPLDQAVMGKSIEAKRTDFEDSIQFFSALKSNADFIVTRNVRDFPQNVIPVLSPENFLAQLLEEL